MSAKPKILIVEDDSDLRKFLVHLLNHSGYDAISAENGIKALNEIDRNAPDLVLLDINLPDIHGHQIIESIASKNSHLPVVAITGDASVESAVETIKRGAYYYFEKPFQPAKLLKTIENALDLRKSEAQGKKAVRKLDESEEKYRQLFEHESDAILVIDVETLSLEDVNKAASDLFGYSKRELMGFSILDLSAEKDKTKKNFRRLLHGKPSKKHIALRYFTRKDGSIVPCDISAGTFISDGHRKVIATIRDISVRLKTERDLRESEERFRNLVENSLVGIAIIQNNRIVYQNPDQEKMYGPITDKTIFQIFKSVHPDDVDKVTRAYEDIVSGNVQTRE